MCHHDGPEQSLMPVFEKIDFNRALYPAICDTNKRPPFFSKNFEF